MTTEKALEQLEQALRLDAVEDYDGSIFALTEWGYQTLPRRNALRGSQEPQEGASDG